MCINPKDRISILQAKDHPYFDRIKDWKSNKDFNFKGNRLKFGYKEEIDKMEKNNKILIEQIKFYKEQISLLVGDYNEEEEENDSEHSDHADSTRSQTK